MLNYQLGNWTFQLWDGPPPTLPRAQVATQTRAGTEPTHLKLGDWGDPVTAKLTQHYASYALASDAAQRIVLPLAAAPNARLWYAGIDYAARYRTAYKVTDIQIVELRAAVRLLGPNFNFSNAGVLTAQVTLWPHYV